MDVLARLSRSSLQRFSAGVAVAELGTCAADLMGRADGACYEAKRLGGIAGALPAPEPPLLEPAAPSVITAREASAVSPRALFTDQAALDRR